MVEDNSIDDVDREAIVVVSERLVPSKLENNTATVSDQWVPVRPGGQSSGHCISVADAARYLAGHVDRRDDGVDERRDLAAQPDEGPVPQVEVHLVVDGIVGQIAELLVLVPVGILPDRVSGVAVDLRCFCQFRDTDKGLVLLR